MRMRKLKDSDYEAFKEMYINSNLQWLYRSDSDAEEESIKNVLYNIGISDSFLKLLEKEYGEYSRDRFIKDKNSKIIYVFESLCTSEKNLVGYVQLKRFSGNEMFIAEWSVMDDDDILEMFKLLKKNFPKKDFVAFPSSDWSKEYWQFLKNECDLKE